MILSTSVLFDDRNSPKATESEAKRFHTHLVKVFYLEIRMQPECLTAVT